MPPVAADTGEAQDRPLPLVLEGHLGGGHPEAVPGAVEDGADDAPLLFERVTLREVQLDLERRYVRGTSRSS